MTYAYIKLAAVTIALLGAGVVGLSRALGRAEVRRRMREAPQHLADHSVVTLTGTVKLVGEPLVAPLSGTRCVLHRSSARTFSQGREMETFTVCELAPFLLETRDGDVLVDGDTADIPDRGRPLIPRKIEREQEFLLAHGILTEARSAGFDEIVIVPGAKISVHGVARVEVDARSAASYRDTPTRVRLVGDAQHPLTIMII
jgi:hypothetical protein